MNTFKEKELIIKKIARSIPYSVEFIPGETEELDMFKAENEAFEVCSYGRTEQEALKNARIQAEEYLKN